MNRRRYERVSNLALTDDIIYFLKRLNDDIAKFIRNSVESSMDIERWSSLSNGFKPLRCWEIKGCRNRECPAYGSEDYRCWLRVGTLCGGEVQGEFAKKYKTCFECEVLRLISQEPVRALYENINTLIFHLHKRTVRLAELAIKDQLTNLYNRHFFNEIIEKETAGAERRARPLSFIMIDIDNFKEINDTLGHLTGDKLLVEAANLIKKVVRKSDLVFRFGGDEFLVILMDADCDTPRDMVQRILDGLDRWNKVNADAFDCRLSFSIGCSTYKKGRNVLEALKEADTMMYKNKNEKRKGGVHHVKDTDS